MRSFLRKFMKCCGEPGTELLSCILRGGGWGGHSVILQRNKAINNQESIHFMILQFPKYASEIENYNSCCRAKLILIIKKSGIIVHTIELKISLLNKLPTRLDGHWGALPVPNGNNTAQHWFWVWLQIKPD